MLKSVRIKKCLNGVHPKDTIKTGKFFKKKLRNVFLVLQTILKKSIREIYFRRSTFTLDPLLFVATLSITSSDWKQLNLQYHHDVKFSWLHAVIISTDATLLKLTSYVTEAWCNLAACFCNVARRNASFLRACMLQTKKYISHHDIYYMPSR